MWNRLKPKDKVNDLKSNSTSQQIENIIKDSSNNIRDRAGSSVVGGVNDYDSISNDNAADGDVDNGGHTTSLMTTTTTVIITDDIRSQFKEEMESLKLRYRAEALKAIAEAERTAYEQGRLIDGRWMVIDR